MPSRLARILRSKPKPLPKPSASSWFHWSYFIDWGLTLGVVGANLAIRYGPVAPTKRSFSLEDPSISYPMRGNTVATWQLSFFALAPAAAIGIAQIWSKSWHDVHNAALGLSEALAMTLFVTLVLKKSVGSLRPDFLARCRPDASGACTGDADQIAAGRDSFPSGHTSTAFAGGTYLALYLWGKLRPFRTGGALWKMLLILSPVVAASLVGVSRIVDHRHRAEDVLAGALIGAGFAYLGYRLNYPNPWSVNGGRPLRRKRIVATPLVGNGTYGVAVSGVLD